jgi:hypothetical protein
MITLKGVIPEKTLKKYQEKTPQGIPGEGLQSISIDTPNYDGNRMPMANKLVKYLENYEGFHWGLFGSPLVAQLPSGERWIYDGGHRVALLQRLYPERKTFPGTIIQVQNKKEIARLFHRINGTSASFVSPEVRFINQVLGDEKGIEVLKNVLKLTNTSVMESEENFVPKEHEDSKPTLFRINVGPLEHMVEHEGKECAVWAIKTYCLAWGQFLPENTKQTGIPITGQIVKALSTLKELYFDFFKDFKNEKIFSDWYEAALKVNPEKSTWIFNNLKHDRMEQRHYGTAYGMWRQFCSAMRNTNIKGFKVPSVKLIENLYNSYEEKKQERTKKFQTNFETEMVL